MHQIPFWFFQRGITPEREITWTRKKHVSAIFPWGIHIWYFKTLACTVLDERTDGRTDRWMHNLKPICPVNFFEVGGITTPTSPGNNRVRDFPSISYALWGQAESHCPALCFLSNNAPQCGDDGKFIAQYLSNTIPSLAGVWVRGYKCMITYHLKCMCTSWFHYFQKDGSPSHNFSVAKKFFFRKGNLPDFKFHFGKLTYKTFLHYGVILILDLFSLLFCLANCNENGLKVNIT